MLVDENDDDDDDSWAPVSNGWKPGWSPSPITWPNRAATPSMRPDADPLRSVPNEPYLPVVCKPWKKKGKRSPYLRSKILFQRSSTIGEQQSAMNIWELDHLKTQLELHLFR